MPQRNRRHIAAIAAVLIAAAARAASPAAGTGDDPLPMIAVRRLGDARLGTIVGRPVAFSPDGKWLLTDGDRGNLWDATTGRELTETDSARAGHAVGFVDDRTLLVVHVDATATVPVSTLRRVDAVTGRTVRQLPWPEPAAAAVPALSGDGRRAVVLGRRFTLIDTAAGGVIADLGAASNPVRLGVELRTPPASFSADGGRLVVVRPARPPGDGRAGQSEPLLAFLYDGRTGRPLPFDPVGASAGAALSPDGRVLVTATNHGNPGSGRVTPLAWDPSDGGRRREPIIRFAFAPTGTRLAWVGLARRAPVVVWDLSARPPGRSRAIVTPVDLPDQLVWSTDGRTLAVSARQNRPDLVDVDAGRSRFRRPVPVAAATAIDASPDGRSLVVGDADGALVRWDLTTGAAAARRDGDDRRPFGPIRGLAHTADGSGLLVAGLFGRVETVDPLTLATVHADATHEQARDLAVAADGRTVAQEGQIATDSRATVRVWDEPTGGDRGRVEQDDCNWDQLALAPDGARLAVSHQGRISLWDLAGGGGPVTCVAPDAVAGLSVPRTMCFSPDGRFLAGVGGECYLWPTAADAGPGPARRPAWSGRTYNARESLAFSATGGLLAAAEAGQFRGVERVGVGGGATVFEPAPADAAAGPAESVCRVSDHDRRVLRVAFVPHRPWLVTAGTTARCSCGTSAGRWHPSSRPGGRTPSSGTTWPATTRPPPTGQACCWPTVANCSPGRRPSRRPRRRPISVPPSPNGRRPTGPAATPPTSGWSPPDRPPPMPSAGHCFGIPAARSKPAWATSSGWPTHRRRPPSRPRPRPPSAAAVCCSCSTGPTTPPPVPWPAGCGAAPRGTRP